MDQLQAQLAAERKQHAFNMREMEKEKALLIRDLLQAKYELAQRDVIDTFSKMESPSALVH